MAQYFPFGWRSALDMGLACLCVGAIGGLAGVPEVIGNAEGGSARAGTSVSISEIGARDPRAGLLA
jgi:hypothetical protein